MSEQFHQIMGGLSIEEFQKNIQQVITNSEDPRVELGIVRYQLIQLLQITVECELSQEGEHPYAGYLQRVRDVIS
jgi:hypothetical protein